MRPQSLTKSLAAASVNAVCISQTPGGAGAMVLNGQTNNICLSQTPGAGAGLFMINGSLAFGGTVVLPAPLPILFVSAGNFAAASITVLGTGIGGQPQTETITGPNAATVTTTKSFKTVSAIQFSASPGAIAVTAYAAQPVLDSQRVLLFTPAADETAHTFAITGTDDRGYPIGETVTGANAVAFSSALSYKTVTAIVISAAASGAIQVGTSSVGASTPIVVDQNISPSNLRVAVEVTGTLNYTGQYTNDDIFDGAPQNWVWNDITALAAQTTTKDDMTQIAPCRAVRLKINSGAGSGKLVLLQPGNGL